MKSISLIVVVKGVVQKALDGLDKVMGVFVDRKNERTYFETNLAEDGVISPVYADAPKPDWFQIQIPGLPNQLLAVVDNGKTRKVFNPISYKNKKGEDRVKLIFRNGTVVHSWYRTIRAVYFAVQVRNGHPFLMKDERFVVEVPAYINGEVAVEDFLLKQGISSDLVEVAAKLKLSLLSADAKPRQYKDSVPTSGVNISSKSKDGLPGTVVAQSEPGDENLGEEEAISETNAQDETDRKVNRHSKTSGKGDKSNRRPKPDGKVKSNSQLLADAKAGVSDNAAAE